MNGHRPHAEHDHHHERGGGLSGWFRHLVSAHSHDMAEQVDEHLEGSHEGIRALWLSLLVLGGTAALQMVVVVMSHSVALLGDTLHNFGDALTALPLGLAFLVGRRPANERHTYGYGRAEDLAGLVVVLVVVASALVAGWQAVDRLRHPSTVHAVGWVAGAAVLGFAGNEVAARVRIGAGKRIGSAALVADGLHARTDGLTSLVVLAGAGGTVLGWRWADPVVGLLITVAIASVARGAIRSVFSRLMDAVDPGLVQAATDVAASVPGVLAVDRLRVRWIGHQLHAEAEIVVDTNLGLVEAHGLTHEVEHQLIHAVPRLSGVVVHASPDPTQAPESHAAVAHHRVTPERSGRRTI